MTALFQSHTARNIKKILHKNKSFLDNIKLKFRYFFVDLSLLWKKLKFHFYFCWSIFIMEKSLSWNRKKVFFLPIVLYLKCKNFNIWVFCYCIKSIDIYLEILYKDYLDLCVTLSGSQNWEIYTRKYLNRSTFKKLPIW